MKFGVDVPISKVVLFKTAVKKFINDRPQEFSSFFGFRMTRVETDLGFAEYVIVVQSRDSWQKITAVLESKARVSAFCLEVQKKLGMKYTSPAMPVNLSIDRTADQQTEENEYDEGRRNSIRSGPTKPGKHVALPSMGATFDAIADGLFGERKKSR